MNDTVNCAKIMIATFLDIILNLKKFARIDRGLPDSLYPDSSDVYILPLFDLLFLSFSVDTDMGR